MLTYPADVFNWTTMNKDLWLEFRHRAEFVRAKSWQGQNVEDNLAMSTWELRQVNLEMLVDDDMGDWQDKIKPNLPWAEEHFLERVGGEPLNPPPSHTNWPHAQSDNTEHRPNGMFSHTYPERFWPKYAKGSPGENYVNVPRQGLRYELGDVWDVVRLLKKDPTTRQAYLPVWFPEDTGATKGQRVPCTLGYHFMIREGLLYCSYYIRSCDYRRHFRDDVYMAGRLMQWMAGKTGTEVERLTMHIGSFHIFDGDRRLMFGANDDKAKS